MVGVAEAVTLVGFFLSPAIKGLVKDLIKRSISYLGTVTAKELEDLETTLIPEIRLTIQAVQRSSPDHKAELDRWLQRLKNAYIEAEGILQKRSSKKKLLKQLRKLQEVAEESKKLHDLLVIDGNIHRISSSILINKVFGRDGVRNEIINFLLVEQGDTSSRRSYSVDSLNKSYSVIAITGVEGVGKTTLVQYVLSDERIKNYFPVLVWLNLSTNLNITKYTKEMIKSVSGKECPNISNFRVLQEQLTELLSESENVMIVLDDVWYDNNSRELGEQQWDCLLAPFAFHEGICKIVATSRSTFFPSALLPEKHIGLCNLERADLKSLLEYHAIDGLQISNPQLMNIDKMTSIVNQIGYKMSAMGKLPLEAKAVGNYLCQHPNIRIWKNILDQNCVI